MEPRKYVRKRGESNVRTADEIINSIAEVLCREDGETIEAAALAAGLKVKYVGDSLFEVE